MANLSLSFIFEIVSTRKNIPLRQVEAAWNTWVDNLKFYLGCGSCVFIPGFGMFWQDHNNIFFTRFPCGCNGEEGGGVRIFNQRFTTEHVIHDAAKSAPQLVPLGGGTLNSVRTLHLPDDPIAIAICIEMNRQILYKDKNVFVPGLGWFLGKKHPMSNWYDYMQEMDIVAVKANVCSKMPKLVAWIPRLVETYLLHKN